MSKESFAKRIGVGSGPPTMIIPKGTQIRVDTHGQLSIRTPGNLVIQNSGSYATLESVSGSIRIEPDVEVEAVTVRCAETCFVQGRLTAWQVVAKNLHLDGKAHAHVLMQQTESMEIGRDARLVGNFESEQELFSLFSRFAREVRSLPFVSDGEEEEETIDVEVEELEAAPERKPEDPTGRPGGGGAEPADGERGDRETLPEKLFFALVLLERESKRASYPETSRRIFSELAKLLREEDLETLKHTHRTLFSRVKEPGEDARRAARLVGEYFQAIREEEV
ncbi:MAG: hypothetical protein R3234_10760 [Thermoanaerobaculia bacterium]|nr:hypothetical protein [Thermoanaerobaculia bacterium]